MEAQDDVSSNVGQTAAEERQRSYMGIGLAGSTIATRLIQVEKTVQQKAVDVWTCMHICMAFYLDYNGLMPALEFEALGLVGKKILGMDNDVEADAMMFFLYHYTVATYGHLTETSTYTGRAKEIMNNIEDVHIMDFMLNPDAVDDQIPYPV